MLLSVCLLSLDGCALQVMEEIRRAGFEAPTPFQAQVSQTPSIDALSLHSISPSDTRPIRTTDIARCSHPCVVALNCPGFNGSACVFQAWPGALQGRDLIGVAKTGSEKTLAFIMPAFKMIKQTRGGTVYV